MNSKASFILVKQDVSLEWIHVEKEEIYYCEKEHDPCADVLRYYWQSNVKLLNVIKIWNVAYELNTEEDGHKSGDFLYRKPVENWQDANKDYTWGGNSAEVVYLVEASLDLLY